MAVLGLIASIFGLFNSHLSNAFAPTINPTRSSTPLNNNGGSILSTSKTWLQSTAANEGETVAVTNDEDDDEEEVGSGKLRRDRYVATNRFAVRKGKAAQFEKRWATRKSRLAVLDGFKYFHLMRRVEFPDGNMDGDAECVYAEGADGDSMQGNYVSFTIWEKKSHFSAWRSGDAFREAHGGTSISAFLSTMVKSAMLLRGAPRPAFYDGLLIQGGDENENTKNIEIVDGWRSNVDADGINTLPAECFVACNQFYVPSENAAGFEQRWASRESKLKQCEGFVGFSMLRRDGQYRGHGTVEMTEEDPTYVSTTIWKDQESFQKWRKSAAFGQAHKPPSSSDSSSSQEAAAKPPAPLWSRPPKPIFYQGTLVITSKDGI